MSGVARRVAPARTSENAGIVEPGRNCWRVARADRFACIQDAADYFRLVRQALLRARRTVFTLGWDTSARTDLLPGVEPADAPKRLDRLLAFIARRRPDLKCYILTWDYGLVHLLERDPFTRWRLGWKMPPNVVFAFDDRHAIGGCHHQKVIVIDDQLAFCGGIDLTGHRWDTTAHRVDEPGRVSLACDAYAPYHEVQAMVSGPCATALGELARDRWRALDAEHLPPVIPSDDEGWPSDVSPDLTNAPVAISRTIPALDGHPPVRECLALYEDSIAAASQAIYIESQYFTDERMADALAARLREPDGPEVIVVTPRDCYGWLEQKTMGAFRDEAFRRMMAADRHNRLRLVYPAASRSRDVPIFVHSKVMFVDDRLGRIGSSNISKRSMGVDTECDLAVDAGTDDALRQGIRRMRDRLLGEHLGMEADHVTREIGGRGSLRAVIDARADADRTLARVHVPEQVDPPPEVLRVAADPDEPLEMDEIVETLAPAAETPSGAPAERCWLVPALAAAAGAVTVAAVIRYTRQHPSASQRRASGAVAAIVLGTAGGLRLWQIARRASDIEAAQRGRAEFG
jgi:phosphatidylserine/phosphatidylglycerophosphate/cardiolipin synthase-like enzyme